MINKEQYERLRPYFDMIRYYGKERVYVGGDLTVVNQVWMEIGNPSCCFGCTGNVANMLNGIFNEIENFERENSGGNFNQP